MEKNQVVARVGEKQITQEYVENVLKNIDPQRAMQFASPEGKQKLVEELVNQELFYLDAINKGLDKDEAFVNEVEKMKENLLKQYAINLAIKDVTVSEADVAGFYTENKDKFISPESVHASHILVDDEATANSILEEINDGLSFEEAAEKHSKCPSKAQGGDLGSFQRGRMVPEFEEAAFAMEAGAISKPVQTQFGFHLIKVMEKQPSEVSPLEEVKPQLTQQLVTMKQQEVYYNKIEELKNQFPVKINL
ncbi:peptidylprolyl isomerase [Alkaliphilus hydrothermalis]|uniref:Peptidyl-prolyl cis-trans isomerase C n=1 Tax=Alkaliphilus hydrothermalis TaxID=1482730 RepID=A0ABS2NPV9_9FIRM|nr:peptidylprolyl isomerase [Alkaliphilus hydrothermalis]MBM7614973.1 peptidyl-prolyl cis-trans isomerase C [Alkaliphilus hydrothermalis]